MNPLPLSVRDPVRFQLDTLHNYACKRLTKMLHLGSEGLIDKDKAPSYAIGLKAALAILERTAPAPKAGIEAHLHGDLVIAWQASPSPTVLEPARPSSISASKTNGHAAPSSSATDALANL